MKFSLRVRYIPIYIYIEEIFNELDGLNIEIVKNLNDNIIE